MNLVKYFDGLKKLLSVSRYKDSRLKNVNKKKKKKKKTEVPLNPLRRSCKFCLKWVHVQNTINDWVITLKSQQIHLPCHSVVFKKRWQNLKISKVNQNSQNDSIQINV